MNLPRSSAPPPVPSGPPVLPVLLLLMAGAHVLRALFALPVTVPPGSLSMEALVRGEWWSVFTWMFTHQDALHLVGNLLLLLACGLAVERHAGGRHLLYVFLATAWAGAALQLVLQPESVLMGASGAAFGMLGAFAALFPHYDLMRPLRGLVPGRLKAKRLVPALLLVFITLEVVRRLISGQTLPGITGVAHLVHAGGLLAGWMYGRALAADDGAEEWNDFFPQGLRRRTRDMDGGLPVAAGLPSLRRVAEEAADAPGPPPPLNDTDFLRERVDPVLEKLYEHGAAGLTPEERAILDEAARRFSRGKS